MSLIVFLIGESVAENEVAWRKHVLSESHLMSVGHIDLSLDQAHCLLENAVPPGKLPVFFGVIGQALPMSNGFSRAWPSGTTVPQ
jgi:hypothetical protein